MAGKSRTASTTIAWIASRNHGVVTRKQLRRAGLSKHEVDGRVATGLLVPVYPGVFRVGHTAWSLESSYLAAVRACGEEAVLSGLAAAHYLAVIKGRPPPPEVTAPTERKVKGVRTRRIVLRPYERTVVRRIPITTVPRTLVDIAAALDLDALALAFREAGHRYRSTPRHIDAVLRHRKLVPGARNLRLVMGREAEVLLSRLERAFMALLRKYNLPLPRTNIRVGAHRIDCYWPEYNLIIELDSYAFHNSRTSWERDRDRERAARNREQEHQRLTWFDVVEDPEPTVAYLRRVLRQPAPRP
jgi:Transcriptional regulator, AbiEi antitoxin